MFKKIIFLSFAITMTSNVASADCSQVAQKALSKKAAQYVGGSVGLAVTASGLLNGQKFNGPKARSAYVVSAVGAMATTGAGYSTLSEADRLSAIRDLLHEARAGQGLVLTKVTKEINKSETSRVLGTNEVANIIARADINGDLCKDGIMDIPDIMEYVKVKSN